MMPLELIDATLGELASQRERAIVQFREALDGAVRMPTPDPFTLTAAINRKLDERIATARYLEAQGRSS